MAKIDTEFPHAVCHGRVELPGIGIYKPDAAAVRSDKVSRHVCIQAKEGICVLLLPDAGSVVENHARYTLALVIALHVSVHLQVFRGIALIPTFGL
jgi:hypothetical protein